MKEAFLLVRGEVRSVGLFVTSHCWKVYCVSFTQPIYQEENFFKIFSLNSYNCNCTSIRYTLDSFFFLLVFYGCYNKLMQTWWLKTTEIHHLTFLGDRNQKQVSPSSNQSVSRTSFIYEGSRVIICFFVPLLFSIFLLLQVLTCHGSWSSFIFKPGMYFGCSHYIMFNHSNLASSLHLL